MKNFTDSNINPNIVSFLTEKGIVTPTEVQATAIPLLIKHEGDFVGRSATGTGKTFAFGIPLLSKIDIDKGAVQAVVLVPTRELCEQVGNELIALSSKIDGLNVEAIYGGVSLKNQITELSQGVQVIVATPGRLMDLVNRKVVHLSSLKTVVFDEADQMLMQGFSGDIDSILNTTDRTYSTWLFSATMPDEINGLIKKYLNKELKKVIIGSAIRTAPSIVHQWVNVNPENKLNVLLHYLSKYEDEQGIIFCRTKSGVQKLFKQLSANKISSIALHGDLPQGLRNKAMEQFKEGSVKYLIATDVAARGVDVEGLAFVFQYHIPETIEAYTHRSGRTSRAGNSGTCLTFVFDDETKKLAKLEEELELRINSVKVPNNKEQLVDKAIIWGKRLAKEKPVGTKLEERTRQTFKDTISHLSKDELMEKMLAYYLREQQK